MKSLRNDFSLLSQKHKKLPIAYFDNAATTLKPQQVLTAMTEYYTKYTSNIHRGVSWLSEKSTEKYEQARKTVQNFLNAKYTEEIVFTRGTTEAINLVAATFGRTRVQKGDEILISYLEHHSNITPWQQLCKETGATLRVLPLTLDGDIEPLSWEKMIHKKTKLVAITHISNTLGTINPIRNIIKEAHKYTIPVLIDGAQGIAHETVDVQALDCDFYVFSGHKVYGPTGIGVLYGKKELLESMPPYQTGGGMVQSVSFEKTLFVEPPYRFEAGTPNIAGAIGLGAALEYVQNISIPSIVKQEQIVTDYAREKLRRIPNLTILGNPQKRASILSFVIKDLHPHDIGTLLNNEGVVARTGHHCTQPLMKFFGVPATTRISFSFYNTKEEVDICIHALQKTISFLL